MAVDEAEQQKIVTFGRTFGDEPSPIGIGREQLDVDRLVLQLDLLLGIQTRELRAQLRCQQAHRCLLIFEIGYQTEESGSGEVSVQRG